MRVVVCIQTRVIQQGGESGRCRMSGREGIPGRWSSGVRDDGVPSCCGGRAPNQQQLGGPVHVLPFRSGVESQASAESEDGELLGA